MSELSSKCEGSLNVRSSSLNCHASQSQSTLPSHSTAALGKSSSANAIEAASDQVISDTAKDKAEASNPATINLDPGTPEPVDRATKPLPAGSRTSVSNGILLDEDFVRKFTILTKLTQASVSPAASTHPTSIREYTSALLKLLRFVPKLQINGSNYQTWIIMVQHALEGTLGHAVPLANADLVLDATEDKLLKTAMLFTIDDDMKLGVAEAPSGLDGLKLISASFTLPSRPSESHVALVKKILALKFNHLDPSADMDLHFRRIENLVKSLFRSGFQLTEESLI